MEVQHIGRYGITSTGPVAGGLPHAYLNVKAAGYFVGTKAQVTEVICCLPSETSCNVLPRVNGCSRFNTAKVTQPSLISGSLIRREFTTF